MNRSVNISKRITTDKGSRFCAVVLATNGRVKPDYVVVDGKPEYHPEGAYYISWYEGNRLKRLSVGNDAGAASARRHRQEQILASRALGITVVDGKKDGRLLVNAAADYLEEIGEQKKALTHTSYTTAINHFLASCSKQTLEEIDRADLLAYIVFLSKRGMAAYSIHNRFSCVVSFLKAQGITGLVKKNDWPDFVQEEPEVYEREDLEKFFAVCEANEHLWFQFFLMTGMREQEVMYCSWRNVNFAQNTVAVKHNPEHYWTPKAYREREIPVPQRLMDELKKWRLQKRAGCDLLFPTKGCKPQARFFQSCKLVAERARLNPDQFWLHKFRATFATWHL
jgi:integrase/recombinase XerD